MEKAKSKIKIGSLVKIKDANHEYRWYFEMFLQMGFNKPYETTGELPRNGSNTVFKVFAKKKPVGSGLALYGIESEDGDQFLFSKEGLALYDPKVETYKLLEEVNERYPLGTIVNCLVNGEPDMIIDLKHWMQNDRVIFVKGKENVIKLYERGKWAEVVKKQVGFFRAAKKPVLLGMHQVLITDGDIICNGGSVGKKAWLSWSEVFMAAIKNEVEASIKLGNYETRCYQDQGISTGKYHWFIDVGCISGVSEKQIKAITKEIQRG